VDDAIGLARHAASAGAHAVSSLPPLKSFPQVLEYYNRLAQESTLPLIVYYFPEACPRVFERPEELEQVCQLPNVSAVKFTDYNLFRLSLLRKAGTAVFNGRDEVLAAGLLMGADGGIGSTYNLAPDLFVKLYRCTQRGDWAQARQIQAAISSFIAVLIRYPFLPALKAVLGQWGFACGPALNGQRFSGPEQQQLFLNEFNAALRSAELQTRASCEFIA
jgi:N-acetylneuraminate lyase